MAALREVGGDRFDVESSKIANSRAREIEEWAVLTGELIDAGTREENPDKRRIVLAAAMVIAEQAIWQAAHDIVCYSKA